MVDARLAFQVRRLDLGSPPPRQVIGRLPGEHSVTSLVWAVLDRASAGWRGFTMTAAGLRLLHDLRRTPLEPPEQLRSRGEPSAADQHGPGQAQQTAAEVVRSA